ncbi:Replication factor C subunit 1 [Thelohanellus kitauei]|uniref:Replication factor C subunit 1 n=1 Tax=Thelohanellus kitauei TaxID=669202 RepID=A0A0C2J6N2_THEKT|nr:Replication factor C subunit 1 [Thelohanellus kitauei]
MCCLEKLSSIRSASESISQADICDKKIRGTNNWSLLPTQAVLSVVVPTDYVAGSIIGQIRFPQWLGKNSSTTKSKNVVKQIIQHSRLKCDATGRSFVLDFLPHFNRVFYLPILCTSEGVNQVMTLMDNYDIIKEDWDNMVELYQWTSLKLEPLQTKTKTALTRTINKHSHVLPYSLSGDQRTKRSADDEYIEENEDASEEDAEPVVQTTISKTRVTKQGGPGRKSRKLKTAS